MGKDPEGRRLEPVDDRWHRSGERGGVRELERSSEEVDAKVVGLEGGEAGGQVVVERDVG